MRKKIFDLFLLLGFFSIWRLLIEAAVWLGVNNIYPRKDFMSHNSLWTNFDGSHYVVIAEQGYYPYQEAFFPLFPLLIRVLAPFLDWNYITAGLVIVHIAFLVALFLLWRLVKLDFGGKAAVWAVVFLLVFPTSFFFAQVYTESLFLALVLGSFLAARKGWWAVASLLGGLATATKFVGIFLLPALAWEWWEQRKLKSKNLKVKSIDKNVFWLLLIPLGLISYMVYLKITVGDPLTFIHVQSSFGANRTGGEIVWLPQVVFRYLKIFITVPWVEYEGRIAILEFFLFFFVGGLCLLSWKTVRKSYLIFSLLAIFVPTLTGTLLSVPRFVLVAFATFIALAIIKNTFLKASLAIVFFLLLVILTMMFTRGYWIA